MTCRLMGHRWTLAWSDGILRVYRCERRRCHEMGYPA